MQISPISVHNKNSTFSNNNISFRSFTEPPSKNDNDDKYVKVPRREYNIDKWCLRILLAITAIEFVHFLVTRKPEPWEKAYKELVKNVKE